MKKSIQGQDKSRFFLYNKEKDKRKGRKKLILFQKNKEFKTYGFFS